MYKNRYKKGHTPWNKQKQVSKKCLFCHNSFTDRESLIGKRKFCSQKCRNLWGRGRKMDTRGGKIRKICFRCEKEFTCWRYERERKYCSKKCWHDDLSDKQSGKGNPNWKGGISPRPLNSRRYREWRKAVFERDDYKCVKCGYSGGRILNAHHKKDWSMFPELRYNVSNGETLCINCHKLTKSFGRKKGSLSNK